MPREPQPATRIDCGDSKDSVMVFTSPHSPVPNTLLWAQLWMYFYGDPITSQPCPHSRSNHGAMSPDSLAMSPDSLVLSPDSLAMSPDSLASEDPQSSTWQALMRIWNSMATKFVKKWLFYRCRNVQYQKTAANTQLAP